MSEQVPALTQEELAALSPVDRMTYSMAQLATEAGGVRAEVAELHRNRRRDRIVEFFGLAISVLLAVVIVVLLLQSRSRSTTNQNILHRLNDCVIAGGSCYQQLQKQGLMTTDHELEVVLDCYSKSNGDESQFIKCLESDLGAG